MGDHALLYDRDCGFCTWIVDVLLTWDRRGRLRPVTLQDPRAAELLPGMDEEERMASFHLVGPDGAVSSGGAAMPALARLLPAGAPIGLVLGASPALTERGYRWIADHRTGVSRLVPRKLKDRARVRVGDRLTRG